MAQRRPGLSNDRLDVCADGYTSNSLSGSSEGRKGLDMFALHYGESIVQEHAVVAN